MKFTGENEKQTAGKNTRSPEPINVFRGLNSLNLTKNKTKIDNKTIARHPVKLSPAYNKPLSVRLKNNKRRKDKTAVTISNNSGTAMYLKS